MTKKITSIVLAAGKGTRMNSSLPKPLHSVAGKPILSHIIENINAASINAVSYTHLTLPTKRIV